MQAEPILLDPFLLVVPANNPLAARKAGVTLAEIGTESVIWASHKKSPRLYDRMLAACEARGFHPRIVMETPTSDITLKFVANDMGVGFVTESLVGHGGPDVAFVPILDFGVAMQLSFVWRRPTGQDALRAFVDFMLPRMRLGVDRAAQRPGDPYILRGIPEGSAAENAPPPSPALLPSRGKGGLYSAAAARGELATLGATSSARSWREARQASGLSE
jgi:hypothetical protein